MDIATPQVDSILSLAGLIVVVIGVVVREWIASRKNGRLNKNQREEVQLMQLETCQDCRQINRIESQMIEMRNDLGGRITRLQISFDELKNTLISVKSNNRVS